jgi:hypothetical protein
MGHALTKAGRQFVETTHILVGQDRARQAVS